MASSARAEASRKARASVSRPSRSATCACSCASSALAAANCTCLGERELRFRSALRVCQEQQERHRAPLCSVRFGIKESTGEPNIAKEQSSRACLASRAQSRKTRETPI